MCKKVDRLFTGYIEPEIPGIKTSLVFDGQDQDSLFKYNFSLRQATQVSLLSSSFGLLNLGN